MVKVGFIVEGDTEKVLVDSKGFRDWCSGIGIEVVEPVINAGGSGNLLPHNIENYLIQIRKATPHKIIVLTDLEVELSVDVVRRRILTDQTNDKIDAVCIAVKAVEAWFLADTNALRRWLKDSTIWEEYPEKTIAMPWLRLREIAGDLNKRGTGPSKPLFAKRITDKFGFALERAAAHGNCPSAKEFYDVLVGFGKSIGDE